MKKLVMPTEEVSEERQTISRRAFLKIGAAAGAVAALVACAPKVVRTTPLTLSPTSPTSTPTESPSAAPTSQGPLPPPVSPSPSIGPTAGPTPSSAPPTPRSPTDFMNDDPSTVDNTNMPITPIDALGVNGTPTEEVDITTYSLSVDGLVNKPLSLDYKSLLKERSVTEAIMLICPEVFSGNCEWTGVAISVLLAEADIKSEATQIVVHAIDDFTETFDLSDLERDGVFLAHTVDGEALPKEHGYPARLVVKGKYGVFWVKQVNRLEVI